MSSQRYNWQQPDPIPHQISMELDIYSSAMQSVLYQRGITTIEDALDFLLPKPPPWTEDINLRHSSRSAEIILDHVRGGKKIAVYGDYDADGITSTAILTLVLREIGAKVTPYIPNRIAEGYGLNISAISQLKGDGVSLLITVDNGIRSISEVGYAKSLGMTVIITDHHTPGNIIPDASALINPKLPDDPYPNKNLAGVGVAYKLICALSKIEDKIDPESYLDLVAIGTIADIVPLNGENRYLVRKGLARINNHTRISINALLGAADKYQNKISAVDISFQIAPRLNSSARLDSETALTPLQLLLCSDQLECSKLAQILDNHNQKRKILSRNLEEKVEEILSQTPGDAPILIALDPHIPLGVAGIAAGYLCRKYNLPAVVGQTGQKYTTASCRSIPDFNMIEALDGCRDLFEHYGGHKLAAGFTIPNKNIPALVNHLNNLITSSLPGGPQTPQLVIDAEISLSEINSDLYQELEKVEPTGAGNPLPIFLTRNLEAKEAKLVGANSDHLKMTVSDGNTAVETIGFSLGSLYSNLPERFDLVYHLTKNEYRGKSSFQLQIIDLRAN